MQQLFIKRQGSGLNQLIFSTSIISDTTIFFHLCFFIKEYKILILLLMSQRFRHDNVLDFIPVLFSSRWFILLHFKNIQTTNNILFIFTIKNIFFKRQTNLSANCQVDTDFYLGNNKVIQKIMSRLNSKQKWKISQNSSFINNQLSRSQNTFILPQRFTPSKSSNNESKLMNASVEKLKLSRLNTSNSQLITPRKQVDAGSVFDNSVLIKEHIGERKVGIVKSSTKSRFAVNARDSIISVGQDQVELIKKEAMRDQQRYHEGNRKILLELKEEFNQFKQSVLMQLKSQKETIQKVFQEMIKKTNIKNPENDKMLTDLKLGEELITNNLTLKIEQFEKKDIKINIEEINSFTSQIKSPKPSPSSIFQKQSTDLQKCSHIVQTINTLNQINDTPVQINQMGKPKSQQKKAIQNYKDKIKEITKNIPKSPTVQRNSPTSSSGNYFKLDRFYNAIEKLKVEVNEIKQINDQKNQKAIRIQTQP